MLLVGLFQSVVLSFFSLDQRLLSAYNHLQDDSGSFRSDDTPRPNSVSNPNSHSVCDVNDSDGGYTLTLLHSYAFTTCCNL